MIVFLHRRTADVRTVGYVECFVLAKEDVLAAIRDYPEAQVKRKSSLIREEKKTVILFTNAFRI